jgi:hypothetical protein
VSLLLGPEDEFLPPAHLSLFQQQGFIEFFCDSTSARRDSAANLITLLMETASAAERGPFRTLASAAADAGQPMLTRRERNYALTRASWSESDLRRAILAKLPFGLIEGLAVEHCEVSNKTEPIFDIFSLHAVGRGFCQPIGWRVVSLPPRAVHADVEQHSESEQRCVVALVEDLLADLQRVRPPSPFRLAPLTSASTALGENFDLRLELARRLPEYVLQVGATFQCERMRHHPYDRVVLLPTIEDLVIPGTPRQIFNGGSRRDAEYACALAPGYGDPVSYWIGRPQVLVHDGGLLGRRPEKRMQELLDIAARVPDGRAAERLGLTRLRNANAAGLQRVALAMSALQMVLEPVRVQGYSPEGGA